MDTVLKERWFELTLPEQMVNIGNEVKRAVRFDNVPKKKTEFLENALIYTNLTMQDPKNEKVIPELQISKEVLEDYNGVHNLACSKEDIQRYYMNYALML